MTWYVRLILAAGVALASGVAFALVIAIVISISRARKAITQRMPSHSRIHVRLSMSDLIVLAGVFSQDSCLATAAQNKTDPKGSH